MFTLRRTAITVTTAATALTLAACGGSEGTPNTMESAAPGGSSSSSSEASFNDADVTFAQEMIVHHEGAIQMAQLAIEKATTPEVQALAERIEAAQAPEIQQMSTWLDDWGQPTTPSMSGMPGMEGMPGMGGSMGMDEGQMASLEAATGVEFDRMFLEMMIEHHTSAIEMAKVEKSEGESADALQLADSIISSQSAEITEMEELLAGLDA